MKTVIVTVQNGNLKTTGELGLPNGWSGVALLPWVRSVYKQKRSLKAFQGCVDGPNEIQTETHAFSIPATKQRANLVYIDARAWYAFINRNDSGHESVSSFLLKPGSVLVTSSYELDQLEICLKQDRCLVPEALEFIWNIWNSRSVLMIRGSDFDEVNGWRLYSDTRIDSQIGFLSCTNYMLIRRFGITRFITSTKFFRDFESLSRLIMHYADLQFPSSTWSDQESAIS